MSCDNCKKQMDFGSNPYAVNIGQLAKKYEFSYCGMDRMSFAKLSQIHYTVKKCRYHRSEYDAL